MERFSFGDDVAFVPRADLLERVTIAPLTAPSAVFWHEGEEHEMTSAAGLTALIIEGESLDRFRGGPTALSAPE